MRNGVAVTTQEIAPRRARRIDPPTVLLTLFTVLAPILLVLFCGGTDRVPPSVVQWLLLGPIQGGFALMAYRVAVRHERGDPARRFWLMFAVGGALWSLGEFRQLLLAFTDPRDPANWMGSTFHAVTSLLGMVVVVVALLRHPVGRRPNLRLDVATVMAGAFTAGVLLIQPPAGSPNPAWVVQLAIALLAQPGVFLLNIFAVLRFFLTGNSPFTRVAGPLGAAAATMQSLVQIFPVSAYGEPRGAWLIAGNVLGSAILLIAVRRQLCAPPLRTGERPMRLYSRLPYGAMFLTWFVGVSVLATQGLTWRAWLVIAGSMLTTSLVVARQVVAFQRIGVLLTERDVLTARLTEQAYSDALTGLANRALFMRQLRAGLEHGPVTVLLIDLDEFKPVNDRFGHAAGDKLLVEVGRRMRACVRDSDTVARLGGDEFAVLVSQLDAAGESRLISTLNGRLNDVVDLDGASIPLRASVGLATGGGEPDALLHEADMAMYAVKSTGRMSRR